MTTTELREAMKRVKDDPYVPDMSELPGYAERVAKYAWVAGRHAALQTCEDLLGLGCETILCYDLLKPWLKDSHEQ